MACAELTAFRTAVESLDQRVLTSPRLGRAMFWRNAIPKGEFVKNQGVTRSTFEIKTTEPADDQSLWNDITLVDGQPSNACDTDYEDIGVAFLERTYGPKKRRFRGPVVCRENLTFQHQAAEFLNKYVDQMGKVIARVWEFTLRRDYVNFASIYVDGTKYTGPNALASAARAFEGPSLDRMDEIAAEQINVGAGAEQDGYTSFGPTGPVFLNATGLQVAGQLLRTNSTVRTDANYASMGKDGNANYSLFQKLGATRTYNNFRLLPTPIPLRLDYNEGYQVVSPFKDITAVGSDNDLLTTAYKNADFEAMIAVSPDVFRADVVTPINWRFPDTTNYNGEWNFITGGERVCSPAVYDPEHEKGRHFAKIEYAAAPVRPYLGAVYIFKRCATTRNTIFCS